MRLTLAFAACAVAFRAPTPPLRRPVALRAATLEEIRKMRASAIQQELRAAGVRYDDCFEKDELAKRLRSYDCIFAFELTRTPNPFGNDRVPENVDMNDGACSFFET